MKNRPPWKRRHMMSDEVIFQYSIFSELLDGNWVLNPVTVLPDNVNSNHWIEFLNYMYYKINCNIHNYNTRNTYMPTRDRYKTLGHNVQTLNSSHLWIDLVKLTFLLHIELYLLRVVKIIIKSQAPRILSSKLLCLPNVGMSRDENISGRRGLRP